MSRISPLMLLPPVLFAALAALFLWGMARPDPQEVPSALIGRAAPGFPEAAVEGTRAPQMADLGQGVVLVNFWASWCPPCRAEHPVLKKLADQGLPIIGVNFKDTPDQAGAYLRDEGNPFLATGFDAPGRVALDWGVTAPPETFIIGADGRIAYRFAGPLVGSDYQRRFLPELDKALRAAGQGDLADTLTAAGE